MSKTLLPKDFSISDELRSWNSVNAPKANIDEEFVNFRLYADSREWRMADWKATFQNWLRKEHKKQLAGFKFHERQSGRAVPSSRSIVPSGPSIEDRLDRHLNNAMHPRVVAGKIQQRHFSQVRMYLYRETVAEGKKVCECVGVLIRGFGDIQDKKLMVSELPS